MKKKIIHLIEFNLIFIVTILFSVIVIRNLRTPGLHPFLAAMLWLIMAIMIIELTLKVREMKKDHDQDI